MGSAGVSDASRLSPPPSHVNPSHRHDRRSGHEPHIPQRDTHHAAVPYPHPDPAQQLQYRKDRRNVTDQPTAHDVTQRPRTGEDDQARLELWRGGCSDTPVLCTVTMLSELRCGKVDKSLRMVSLASRGGAPWRPSSCGRAMATRSVRRSSEATSSISTPPAKS